LQIVALRDTLPGSATPRESCFVGSQCKFYVLMLVHIPLAVLLSFDYIATLS